MNVWLNAKGYVLYYISVIEKQDKLKKTGASRKWGDIVSRP